MSRIGVAGLIAGGLALAACASGNVASDDGGAGIDSGASGIDASTSSPDAGPSADAGPTPDAGPPDATPLPDADPSAPPEVLAVTPGTGSIAGGESVTVTGNNFFADVSIDFGAATASCTYESPAAITCVTPAAGSAGSVDVIATQSSGSDTLTAGFLYWDATGAVDDCNLVPPSTLDAIQASAVGWQARVYEPGITDVTTGTDASGTLAGQIGYGPSGSDPTSAPGWTWFDLTGDASYGPASPTYMANYDQYEHDLTVPARGQYARSARFTIDGGVSWKFCGTGQMISRQPKTCAVDGECFSDEKCLDDRCRVDCDTNTDCKPWGPQCTGLGYETDGTTLELFCDPGAPGGGPLGADCASDSGCESGLCLVDLTDTCTVGCGTSDANCSSAAGNVCTEFSGIGLCAPGCGATSDCDSTHVCILNVNEGQNRYDTLCLVPDPGAVPDGDPCGMPIACESGICLTGPDLCTAPCNTNADCPASLPSCGLGTITRPNGVGDQTIPICVQ